MRALTVGHISYLTDSPSRQYQFGLDSASTREQLLAAIDEYRCVADDAYTAVERMTSPDLEWFLTGLPHERKKSKDESYVGPGSDWEERFAVILMPEVMLRCDIIAGQFGAPWGTAFIRLRDMGQIKVSQRDGIAHYEGGKS